jgi:hypothetical protein
MASTYTARLKLERQTSGENSGNWGNLVNYVMNRVDCSVKGYQAANVAGNANVTLTSANSTTNTNDTSTDDQVHNAILEFTGALTANIHVFTDAVETKYTVFNNTSGSYTLTFANTGHAANGVALKQGAKTLIYSTASAIVDVMGDLGDIVSTSITPGSIKFADNAGINDAAGNEQVIFSQTASAVNYLDITNSGTGNPPSITAGGSDANVSLNLIVQGSGTLQANAAAIKIAGTETMWVPASAMYATTTNPAEAAQVETTALRPDMKVFDFADTADDFVQFSVAMPKSWNLGTVTYQVFWTPSTTNTGNCIFGLQGVAIGDGDTIDIAYGTAVDVTDAGIGTIEDQQVSPVSGDVTIAGSPADDQQTYFQLYRDANAGGDTYTGVARVLGIKIFYTTDAANDG